MKKCLFVAQDADWAIFLQNRESSLKEPFTIRNVKKCKKTKNTVDSMKWTSSGLWSRFFSKMFFVWFCFWFQKAPIFCIDRLLLGGISVCEFLFMVLKYFCGFRVDLLFQLFLLFFR